MSLVQEHTTSGSRARQPGPGLSSTANIQDKIAAINQAFQLGGSQQQQEEYSDQQFLQDYTDTATTTEDDYKTASDPTVIVFLQTEGAVQAGVGERLRARLGLPALMFVNADPKLVQEEITRQDPLSILTRRPDQN